MSIIAYVGGASSGTDNVETSDSTRVNYSNMGQVNIFDFGVDANIQLPKEDKGPRKIENSATESITIAMNDKFRIEINPFGLTVSEKKEELDGDLVYTIEYI